MLSVKYRFRSGHRDTFEPSAPWELQSVFLNLTERCDFSCVYCHAESDSVKQTMPLSMVETVLTQAAEIGDVAIVLTGGEPLCYPHLDEMLALCRARQLRCKIATNGTRLTPETVETLCRHGVVSLQISLDTMDPLRFAEIKGSTPGVHADVLDGIRRCVDSRKLHVVVSTVVREAGDKDHQDVLRWCHDNGVDTFTIYQLIPFGRAGSDACAAMGRDAFPAAAGRLCEAFAALPEHWAVDICVPSARDSAFLREWRKRLDIRHVACKAGKKSMMVLANGDGVPCTCMSHPAFSCGNIASTRLADMWRAPIMSYFRGERAAEGCADCASRASCLNGCRTMAFLSSGRLDGPDPDCKVWMDP